MIDTPSKYSRQCSRKAMLTQRNTWGRRSFPRGKRVWPRSQTRREWTIMNRMLQNHWCRFLAGNASVVLLTVGIPVAILLAVTSSITWSWAVVGILAIVHASLIGLQISKQGTWVP